MDINLIQVFLIIIFASLAWWANATLNTIPVLKNIVSVLIVVIAVLCLLNAIGLGSYVIHV